MANTLTVGSAVLVQRPARASRNDLGSCRNLPLSLISTPRGRKGRYERALIMTASAAKKVLVPIANGSEEMEAVLSLHAFSRCVSPVTKKAHTGHVWTVQVIIIDVLRRAGADVTVASVESTLQVLTSEGWPNLKQQCKSPRATHTEPCNPLCRWTCPGRSSLSQTSPSRTLLMIAMTPSHCRCDPPPFQ